MHEGSHAKKRNKNFVSDRIFSIITIANTNKNNWKDNNKKRTYIVSFNTETPTFSSSFEAQCSAIAHNAQRTNFHAFTKLTNSVFGL